MCYVDDCLFFAKDVDRIDKFIDKLKIAGMGLTVKEDVHAFLGVEVNPGSEEGSVVLTQTSLIDKLLKTVGMVDFNAKGTLASTTPLATDELGPPHSLNRNMPGLWVWLYIYMVIPGQISSLLFISV